MKVREDNVIFFDGYCNLCNAAVEFVLKRDKKQRFRYASLQSPLAKTYMNDTPGLGNVDSMVLYQKNKFFTRSSAALKIARSLGALWPLTGIFWIVPKPVRDGIYNYVAKNRYKWFGRKDSCYIPDKKVDHLFLD